jgi:hypothetical protein
MRKDLQCQENKYDEQKTSAPPDSPQEYEQGKQQAAADGRTTQEGDKGQYRKDFT